MYVTGLFSQDRLVSSVRYQMVLSLRESLQKNTAAREAAELANRSKSEFLANMSHGEIAHSSESGDCQTEVFRQKSGHP